MDLDPRVVEFYASAEADMYRVMEFYAAHPLLGADPAFVIPAWRLLALDRGRFDSYAMLSMFADAIRRAGSEQAYAYMAARYERLDDRDAALADLHRAIFPGSRPPFYWWAAEQERERQRQYAAWHAKHSKQPLGAVESDDNSTPRSRRHRDRRGSNTDTNPKRQREARSRARMRRAMTNGENN